MNRKSLDRIHLLEQDAAIYYQKLSHALYASARRLFDEGHYSIAAATQQAAEVEARIARDYLDRIIQR